MYTDLLTKLKTALLARNPGIAPLLQAGLPQDSIRQQLKRAGVSGQIDAVVEMYSWHNGTRGAASKHVYNLGFAPPTITEPLQKNIEYLQSLGHKIDPNFKVYGSFVFFDLESVLRSLKLWKKFRSASPQYARLFGRCVPFLSYSQTGQQLALDIDAAANSRVISIQPSNMKDEPGFRQAYPTYADFLLDAIRANETNQLLAWLKTPGAPIDLPEPAPAAAGKPRAKSKSTTIPVAENVVVVRTDFSDDTAWESLKAKLSNSTDYDVCALDFLSDRAFEGLTPKQLPKRMPEDAVHAFAILVDQTTVMHAEHPLLIVDLQEKPGRSFRATPAELAEVHANLTTANMDFDEFIGATDDDGIFRSA